jgi:hypothetical protein
MGLGRVASFGMWCQMEACEAVKAFGVSHDGGLCSEDIAASRELSTLTGTRALVMADWCEERGKHLGAALLRHLAETPPDARDDPDHRGNGVTFGGSVDMTPYERVTQFGTNARHFQPKESHSAQRS